MEAVSLIIISGVSTIGAVGLSRISYVVFFTLEGFLKRKNKKKKLKKQLYKSIKDLDYIDFVNTIYEIKNYDDEYKRTLFIKVKKQFFFNNKQIEDVDFFMKRFNDNFIKNEELKKMIHEEVSLILSQTQSRLDL